MLMILQVLKTPKKKTKSPILRTLKLITVTIQSLTLKNTRTIQEEAMALQAVEILQIQTLIRVKKAKTATRTL
jgi:hypothetical protein